VVSHDGLVIIIAVVIKDTNRYSSIGIVCPQETKEGESLSRTPSPRTQ
jgi:hypothetical protein